MGHDPYLRALVELSLHNIWERSLSSLNSTYTWMQYLQFEGHEASTIIHYSDCGSNGFELLHRSRAISRMKRYLGMKEKGMQNRIGRMQETLVNQIFSCTERICMHNRKLTGNKSTIIVCFTGM